MILSLAPMEGITGHVFRRVHADCFGALDRYYTPFIAPPRVGCAASSTERRSSGRRFPWHTTATSLRRQTTTRSLRPGPRRAT